ncbi:MULTISPECIES: hypothetical protein [Sphingomonas]|uniref:Uncharacterized protein n=1 Tax=Edaphosphingomonas fennica TaxID=114404 RepID=A0A2T4I7D8_9SPHN|nr:MULTISPECIES: hypothetical protein [Sphingomonas]AGH50109.1 hypothetical protein G432_11940 [Sphingomonas sp. MM-1]MDX3883029.1 hypothetical protein [Sphingomonas sp.]PTD27164.1 hypothetical protein CV103_02385 [Sphingomonas fennica]
MSGAVIEPDVAGVRRAVIAHLKPPHMTADIWLIALAITTGTNLIDFATKPQPGEMSGAFIAAAAIRVIAVFWLAYAVIRRIAGVPRPFAPGAPLARYLGVTILLAIGFGLFSALGTIATGKDAAIADIWLAHMITTAIWYAFTIAILAWQAALAIGDAGFPLRHIFARQQGRLVPLWLAYAALVLPFAAVHFALTLVAVKIALPARALAALSLVDGAVSAVQLAIGCALGVVAWKIALPLREGAASR